MKLIDAVKEAYYMGSKRGAEMAPSVRAGFKEKFQQYLADVTTSGSLTDIVSSFYHTSIYPAKVIIQLAKENPYPYGSLRQSAFAIGALSAIIRYQR